MSTTKVNWGTKVAMLYGGFVALIVILVTMSMKQDFQLVSKDYYEQEIKYQEIIDAGKNQAALSTPVIFKANEQELTIVLPAEFSDQVVKGKIVFYAPADAKFDTGFELLLQNNTMIIPREKLHSVNYKVKINWEAENKKYYQETNLNLYHQ